MSTLREEAERAMREEAEPYDCIGIEKAVSVAVALVEGERAAWGHSRCCMCKVGRRDPGCAPLPGEETKEGGNG